STGIVLVAEYEGKIVGTSYVKFLPLNDCWFQALRVHGDYRRLGLGNALTIASIEHAKASGKKRAYLGIDSDNTASLTMTARAGFSKISEYARLLKKLPTIGSEILKEAIPLRRASTDDLNLMLKLAEEYNKREFIACWQWQPFSREALQRNTEDKHIWVQDDPTLTLFAGFEDFEGEVHLFDPVGAPEDILHLIHTLTNSLARQQEVTFEVWLHHQNPLIAHLIDELGFAKDDGYTIWEYPLTKATTA
ncbi:MAG: GNAT family N-acetyltransferase, partial [bacterium]|nr:GNAT family N-acetyltransferase [bacterium]